jgi:hypothetical protein
MTGRSDGAADNQNALSRGSGTGLGAGEALAGKRTELA